MNRPQTRPRHRGPRPIFDYDDALELIAKPKFFEGDVSRVGVRKEVVHGAKDWSLKIFKLQSGYLHALLSTSFGEPVVGLDYHARPSRDGYGGWVAGHAYHWDIYGPIWVPKLKVQATIDMSNLPQRIEEEVLDHVEAFWNVRFRSRTSQRTLR